VEISPATVVAMKQANLQNEVATAVLRKSLDIQAQQGQDLVKLMAQSGGVGGRVDLYA
jgi:hypothetical protein